MVTYSDADVSIEDWYPEITNTGKWYRRVSTRTENSIRRFSELDRVYVRLRKSDIFSDTVTVQKSANIFTPLLPRSTHVFVVQCFVVVIITSQHICDKITHIFQGCFTYIEAIAYLSMITIVPIK